MPKNKVLLSFDLEEFDLPREHGAEISLKDGVKVSSAGAEQILKVLNRAKVKATFFVTGNFAQTNPSLVQKIATSGHEIACHGVDHFHPQPSDFGESKKILEKVIKDKVSGYRQPRMGKIDYQELRRLGYKYDSSVNPAFIPGRYNNLKTPRRPFKKSGLIEIPTSAATGLRIPLFWLSLHLFPKNFYFTLVKSALKRQGYFTTYFHPWEFTDLHQQPSVPSYIAKNSGEELAKRLAWLIQKLKQENVDFITYQEFAKEFV